MSFYPYVPSISNYYLNERIADCDEYCLEIEEEMERNEMGKEDKHILTETIPPDTRLCPFLNNRLTIFKTEKLVYTALLNPNSNKKIYKILLAKYDELTGLSYEILSESVVEGFTPEGEYLEYCKGSLVLRENMRDCCSFGYGGYL
tara:strand:+ start:1586 stop:2023 length:438 start_codon:yes stop_codon:yes gene_type:complete